MAYNVLSGLFFILISSATAYIAIQGMEIQYHQNSSGTI
jgi:hypothetical protein